MEAESGGKGGSGDHDREEDARYDHPREKTGAQAGVTRCSNAWWQMVRGWKDTAMGDHGCEWEGDRYPSVRALIGCA